MPREQSGLLREQTALLSERTGLPPERSPSGLSKLAARRAGRSGKNRRTRAYESLRSGAPSARDALRKRLDCKMPERDAIET
jgi:hypothetical protein